MNLYTKYPHVLTYKGDEYRTTAYFNRILECVDILDRDDLSDADKVDVVFSLLFDERIRDPQKKSDLITALFESFPSTDKDDSPPSISFAQDAGLIRAGFLQAYGIRLDDQFDVMTWPEFLDLLQGLPADTRMMEIAELRQRPLPKPTKYNQEEIQALSSLKTKYAIRDKKNPEKALDGALRRMFEQLKGWCNNA